MNTFVSHLLEMFVRVRDFGVEYAAAFRSDSPAPDEFENVQVAAAELNIFITTQNSGLGSVGQATAARVEASEALREDMQAVARTARVLALNMSGLENKFRMPRSGSDQALIQAARSFAADAVPLKDEFIRRELPNTFIEDLLADIANLERAIDAQNVGRGKHIAATASIEEIAERGMNAVRHLDVIVRNRFRREPGVLAAWEHARHIRRPARTPKRTNGAAEAATSDAPKQV